VSDEVGASVVARLRAAGCVFAEDEARLLVEAAPDAVALDALVSRRSHGAPLEHILGWAEFRGLRVRVDEGVFVPRRRTEFLADLAIAEGAAISGVRAPTVLDLCCGAGALAAAVESEVPKARVFAADLDGAAVACARRNLRDADHAFEGDLFDAIPADLQGGLDVIVVNAPYVPTGEIRHMPPEARDFEARIALDGGTDGLDLHRRIAAEADGWLVDGGLVVIETSDDQADRTAALFTEQGFDARIETDPDRDATAVTARTTRRR
jgi:release factor glutamine methyltransferase